MWLATPQLFYSSCDKCCDCRRILWTQFILSHAMMAIYEWRILAFTWVYAVYCLCYFYFSPLTTCYFNKAWMTLFCMASLVPNWPWWRKNKRYIWIWLSISQSLYSSCDKCCGCRRMLWTQFILQLTMVAIFDQLILLLHGPMLPIIYAIFTFHHL